MSWLTYHPQDGIWMGLTSDSTPISSQQHLSCGQSVFSEWALNAFHSDLPRIWFQHEYHQKDRGWWQSLGISIGQVNKFLCIGNSHFFQQGLPPDIILQIATYSIIFPLTMWCCKVVPTCWSTMIFFMKEDVGEVKLVFEMTWLTMRPVVDLLFHGNLVIFDFVNYNVVVEPYAILFVLQVIWY